MAERSDLDVFGLPPLEMGLPPAQPTQVGPREGERRDEDVFGASAPGAERTDTQAFGSEVDPKLGGYPGVWDYAKSFVKGVPMGVKGIVASGLQGVAGYQADRPGYEAGQSPLELAMKGDERAFDVLQGPPPTGAPLPTAEHPLYRAGEALGEWGKTALAPKPGTEFAFDIGSGAGSLVGGIGLSVLSPIGAGLAFVSGGSGEATERAVKAGATPEQIANAARFGTVAGATDVVDALLPTLGTPGRVAGLLGKVGSKVLIGALAEGGQEGLQQFIQNLIAKGIYKPDQDIKEGVAYNALIGAIVGGAAKPILDRSGAERGMPTEEEIRAVFGTPPPAEPPAAAPPAAAAPESPFVRDAEGNQYYPSGPSDGAPPGAPTDISSRIRVYQPPAPVEPQAEPAPEAVAAVPDAEADALLRSWVGDTTKRLHGLAITNATIDNNAAMLPQWREMAKREIAGRPAGPAAPPPGAGFEPGAQVPGEAPAAAPVPSPTESRSTFRLDARPPPEPPRNEVPSNVVDFLSARAARGVPARAQPIEEEPDPNAPQYERRKKKGEEPPAEPQEIVEKSEEQLRAEIQEFSAQTQDPTALSFVDAVLGAPAGTYEKKKIEAALEYFKTGKMGTRAEGTSPRALGINQRTARTNARAVSAGEPPAKLTYDQLRPLKQEITARPGADLGRLAQLLGPQLYDLEQLPKTTIKEIVQNSFDAIKGLFSRGEIEQGRIDIKVDRDARTVTITDNGSGMSPEILATKFLEIAGTHKEGGRSSGGFGIAKMAFLFGNKLLNVITMQNGKVATLVSTGPELFEAMSDPTKRPKIQIRTPTAQERKLFPDGSGTAIQVTIPETYTDSSGNVKDIRFPYGASDIETLTKSPLFDNIVVSYNGSPMDGSSSIRPGIGAHFPIQDFTQFANVNFAWGTARIYVTQEPRKAGYGGNAHVLSNGLWQFSLDLKKDPGAPYGASIDREFYIDVVAKGKPEEGGYPFQLNRQGFTQSAEKDFRMIANYISLLYRHEDLAESASSFGNVHYFQENPETGKLEKISVTVTPEVTPMATPANMIKPGDKVSIVDGKIMVNGRQIPELTPEMLKSFVPQAAELIVDQDTIDAERIMVHDNVLVNVSPLEKKSITQLGEEKFGERFNQFLFEIGDMFKALRDVVADMTMEQEDMALASSKTLKEMGLSVPTVVRDYSGLKTEAIGISFDVEYRGVSIKVPFSGMFINPAIPEFNDPQRAAVGIVWTMQHELAHFKERNHGADYEAESSRLRIHLDTHPTFNYAAFKQDMINEITKNYDIFQYINGIFTGAFDIEPRGKRFSDAGSYEAGDGRGAVAGTSAVDPRTGAPGVPGGAPAGEGVVGASARRPDAGLRATETGVVDTHGQTRSDTLALRASSGDSEVEAAPAQAELEPMRQAVQKIFQQGPGGGPPPPDVKALMGHATKMNWYYKFFMGVDRLVDQNPWLNPLVVYNEVKDLMRGDVNKILDQAQRIAKQWRGLGAQKENLAALMDDVARMTYRTPAEVKAGVGRHPTKDEFAALVKKHGADRRALAVFSNVRDFFHVFLDRVMENAANAARRNYAADPVKLANKLDAIVAQYKEIQSRPYFPTVRFGRHFVQIKNAKGVPEFFQTYERQGLRSAQSVQMAEYEKIKRAVPPGYTVHHGTLPETAVPFVGLPAELMEGIETELNLTGGQRDAMRMLRMEISPATRFAHRFKNSNYTPGYSQDFLRSFSRFAFHGARYYGKTKYKWALEQAITDATRLGLVANDNKIGAIASYMRDHLDNTIMDTRGDFGFLKGGIFLWTFGYSVAGATLNLSQVPMVTHPWLAAKFGGLGLGDGRSAWALAKAAGDIRNYYRRGSYSAEGTAKGKLPAPDLFLQKALEYAISTGRITETQASELASLSKAETLLGLGNNKLSRGFQQFMEYGTLFFEFAEQYNRRLTFRAALNLAQKHPGSKAEKEAVNKHAEELQKLISVNKMNPSDARAVITAIYAVEQTQFVYAKENRPRIMRGRIAGTILVFKTYLLNLLQLLGANKASMLPRFLIQMLAVGGIMGLPGAEDAEDIANILGKWWFGKDFKLRHELRQMLISMGQGEHADVALHGLARRGFGVPALLDLLGEKPGRGLGAGPGQNVPAPVLDRSKAIGMGRLLPFELGKLADPGKDVDRAIAEQTQRASGAVFSVGFNLYKSIQSVAAGADPGDFKTWEKSMPRAVSAATRSWRAYTEGRERGKGGMHSAPTVVPYDVRDTEQMGEIIAMGLGYMPLRQAQKWDFIMADAEVKAKFKFEQEIILRQGFEARMGRDPQEIERANTALRDFNKSLPEWAAGYKISYESLERSVGQRAREKIHREAGVPSQLRDVPISRHMRELFPEIPDSVIDVRRVPR